ncbi:unnamed protein product [Coffea canephora]|uniref:Agenet domain-containing protein n=1 Tax=Coffea canephora TaxID=49390 RepID=A0A068V967_COFCA|nr:unnamed protein product [Coffea canephora]
MEAAAAGGGGGVDNVSFKKGAQVEVSFEEEGFRGSWYTATVLRPVSKKTNKIYLQFHTLVANDEPGSSPLQEHVDLILVRPVPPREPRRSFQVSDEVDAFHNDGWWEGIVIHVFPPPTISPTTPTAPPPITRYSVFFRSSREQLDFPETDLRLHREWVHGKWVPALEPTK